MSRSSLLLGCSAFFLTSAAPPPPPDAPRGVSQDRGSPVHCMRRTQDDYRRNVALAAPSPMYVPPPSPPAPPPPVMSAPVPMPTSAPALARASGIVASGSPIGGKRTPEYGSRENTERYDGKAVASILAVVDQPVSTFSVDVDTGAYANVRRMLTAARDVPGDAVRTEEMINYFRYDYPRPTDREAPFSVTTDVSTTPWNAETRLMRIGLRGYDVDASGRPPANLVFLVDVSGSMNEDSKLPLVKKSLSMLADRIGPKDRVSIVAYSGTVATVLDPTSNKKYIRQAIDCLYAEGSTAGGDAMKMAYSIARANFIKGGVNRILMATDGDFNVGVSDNKTLIDMVKRERDSGITLTTLGFGAGNYNEAMMEQVADAGNGNYAYIDSAMEAQKVLEDELSSTLLTIASDVKVQVEFNPAQVKQYRLIGYENRALAEEDFANDSVDAGDIGAGHQVTALYEIVPVHSAGWIPERRYEKPPQPVAGISGGEFAHVRLRYKLPGENASRLIARPLYANLLRNAGAPQGDMAFVTAVAAFGQKLRGDKYLNGYGYAQIGALAPPSSNYWRSEFVRLVRLAESGQGAREGRD
ncbi:MAG: VWA domain-containing protein [Sphingomonadales bacterium]|nr:MAG: VWA domain-containing protein [Sphingomonadales bacterium]